MNSLRCRQTPYCTAPISPKAVRNPITHRWENRPKFHQHPDFCADPLQSLRFCHRDVAALVVLVACLLPWVGFDERAGSWLQLEHIL
jgi:hypothetical protein